MGCGCDQMICESVAKEERFTDFRMKRLLCFFLSLTRT